MLETIRSAFIPIAVPPVFFATTAFIAGIIAERFPLIVVAYLLGLTIFTLIFVKESNVSKSKLLALTVLFLIAGLVRFSWQNKTLDAVTAKIAERSLSIEGTVISVENPSFKKKTTAITLLVHSINYHEGAKELLQCKLKFIVPRRIDLQVADEISIRKVFCKKINPQQRLYLLKEELASVIFCPTFDYKLLQRPAFSINKIVSQTRLRILKNLAKKIPVASYRLFCTLFLGKKSLGSDNAQDHFAYWGISHYLARSGLHLVVIIIIWNLILSFLQCNYIVKQIILSLLLAIFSLLSWSSISFVRSLVTFFLSQICLLSNVPLHTLSIFSSTCLILLILNPSHLFAVEFQLTCLITFALVWYGELNQAKKLQNY